VVAVKIHALREIGLPSSKNHAESVPLFGVTEPKPQRFPPRSAEAREGIIDAAIRLIDAKGPNPSMDDIAREAGATKPRLYRQFEDKEELFTAIAQRSTDQLYNAIVPKFNFLLNNPIETINYALTGYADTVTAHPNVFRFLLHGQHVGSDGVPLSLKMERELARRFEEMARSIFATISLDSSGVAFVARATVGAIVSITDFWLESASDQGEPDIAPFVEQGTPLLWGLLETYLRRLGVETDATTPFYISMAKYAGTPEGDQPPRTPV
jgi:AcrR family transcriptional regulator